MSYLAYECDVYLRNIIGYYRMSGVHNLINEALFNQHTVNKQTIFILEEELLVSGEY